MLRSTSFFKAASRYRRCTATPLCARSHKAGRRLFQQLFYGPGATADSVTVGQFIEAISKDRDAELKVQIVAKETPIPWGLMYIGDASDGAQLDWYNFLGMRHIIEQIPFQSGLKVDDPRIRSDNPNPWVSLYLNETIDAQMRSNFVGEQKTFWSTVATSREPINVIRRTTAGDVLNALRRSEGCRQDHVFLLSRAVHRARRCRRPRQLGARPFG